MNQKGWSCLVTLLSVVILLSASSAADAAEFPYLWYGGGNLNCWQAGQLGAEAEQCDSVGPGFLRVPGRLTTTEGLQLSPSGDYCIPYGLKNTLNKEDSTNEGSSTGLTTPTPYSEYQEWDGNGDVCQANQTSFGQEIRDSQCLTKETTCGMHHYVSFVEQGQNDQPWASYFGNPSLVVSAEADVAVLLSSNPQAWGYICPMFEDLNPPHNILEYCLQEWRGPGKQPL